MRLVFSLMFVAYTTTAFGQATETFKGNTLTFSAADTATVMDPIQGTTTTEPVPIVPLTLNGEKIYNAFAVKSLPVYTLQKNQTEKIAVLLFNTVKEELDSLDDGEYVLKINNPVISKSGSVAYYKYAGLKQLVQERAIPYQITQDNKTTTFTRVTYAADDSNIPVGIKTSIDEKIRAMLDNMPPLTPAMLDQKPVNVTGDMFHTGSVIVIKNHKAIFVPDFFAL